ncbi:MAG: hypothetical protein ACLTKE_03920 [Coprococcus sp.]
MSKRIITIGRQFGSNGRLIGIALAERASSYPAADDKDLIKLALSEQPRISLTAN